MASTKQSNSQEHHGFRGPRPFWSGTIAFGLVNLPVGLYPAHHSRAISLREVDEKGRPLARRFFSESGRKPLKTSELTRGIEVEKDRYVAVDEQEIEDAALEHRREIELSRFVALDELDPLYFRRAYFLVPDSRSGHGSGALKAYRLLAAAMEKAGRAGIATLVMRGREVLVAILAERGILRAEALRFHDELRSPDDIGLDIPGEPAPKRERQMRRAIDKLTAKRFDPDELIDPHIEALEKRVRQKRRRHEDIVAVAPSRSKTDGNEGYEDDGEDGDEQGAEVIDLMQVLKRSLKKGRIEPESDSQAGQRKTSPRRSSSRSSSSKASGDGSAKKPKSDQGAKSAKTTKTTKTTKTKPRSKSDLEKLSRDALYELAQAQDIAGRSGMTKAELIKAVGR